MFKDHYHEILHKSETEFKEFVKQQIAALEQNQTKTINEKIQRAN